MTIGTFGGPKILWRNAGVGSRFTAAVLTLAMLGLIILQGMGATTVIKSVNASGVTPTGGSATCTFSIRSLHFCGF
jgi:hypothetical protein